MNTKAVTAYASVLSAVVAWLFAYVFHRSMPVEVATAIPFVVGAAVQLGVGKLFARAEPKVADVLAHVVNVEAEISDIKASVNTVAMAHAKADA